MQLQRPDIANRPIDSNGNHLDEYRENDQVRRVIDLDDFDAIGVDSRGLFVFADADSCTVVNVGLDADGRLDMLRRDDLFGCDPEVHLREIAARYRPWRWVAPPYQPD